MKKKRDYQIRSFDFSEIGEERQIIVEAPASVVEVEGEEKAEEPVAPPKATEVKDPPVKKLGYIPVKPKVKEADRVSESMEEDYLSVEGIRARFREEINGKFQSGIWISTESYLNSAFKDLKVVDKLEKRIDATRFSSQMVSSLRDAILWLKSIRSYVNTAMDIAKANESRTGKLPLDLTPLLTFMDEVISQREMRMAKLRESLSGRKTA